jgi:hypothetical protein
MYSTALVITFYSHGMDNDFLLSMVRNKVTWISLFMNNIIMSLFSNIINMDMDNRILIFAHDVMV